MPKRAPPLRHRRRLSICAVPLVHLNAEFGKGEKLRRLSQAIQTKRFSEPFFWRLSDAPIMANSQPMSQWNPFSAALSSNDKDHAFFQGIIRRGRRKVDVYRFAPSAVSW